MNRIDHLALDGHSLVLFLTVAEEGSVTAASDRLGVTQSAVSHGLAKLRDILGDPLFVKAGRGITPTRRAEELVPEARAVLASLRALATPPAFDPATTTGEVTIAANEYQGSLILPYVLDRLRREAPQLTIRIVDSGFADPDLLRHRRVDVMTSPMPPDGTEFVQRFLFSDPWVCFFDSSRTEPPDTLDRYVTAHHAKVVFSQDETGPIDRYLRDQGRTRHVALKVQSFSDLGRLMRGTSLVALLPSNLGRAVLNGLDQCASPIPLEPMPFYLVWHRRDHHDPLNRWLRTLIREAVTAMGLGSDRRPP